MDKIGIEDEFFLEVDIFPTIHPDTASSSNISNKKNYNEIPNIALAIVRYGVKEKLLIRARLREHRS